MEALERKTEYEKEAERRAWLPESTVYCSFCGKSQDEVEKMIAGNKTFICDTCVDICAEILETERNGGEL